MDYGHFFYHCFSLSLFLREKQDGSLETTQRIIKQPLSQTPGEVFQKHKYFHEAVMHLAKIL